MIRSIYSISHQMCMRVCFTPICCCYSIIDFTGFCDTFRHVMMTSSNRNIFRVTGLLRGELTGHRWIHRTKASDAELWCLSLICAWMNGWVNNCEAGDLRRHLAHYDVTVMSSECKLPQSQLHCMINPGASAVIVTYIGKHWLKDTKNDLVKDSTLVIN